MYISICLLCLLLYLTYKLILWPAYLHSYYKSRGVATCGAFKPIIGTTLETKALTKKNEQYVYKIELKHFLKNPKSGLLLTQNMYGDSLMVGDPVLAQDVFHRMGTDLDKSDLFTKYLGGIVFPKAFINEETNEVTKERRNSYQKAFSYHSLKKYADIFNDILQKWVEKHKNAQQEKILMDEEIFLLMLELLGGSLFGENFPSIQIDILEKKVTKTVLFKDCLSEIFILAAKFGMKYFLIKDFPIFIKHNLTSELREFYENIRRVYAKVKEMLLSREKDWIESGKEFKYLSDIMLLQREEGNITYEQMEADAIMFMFAGYESTAKGTTSFFHRIAQHPEVIKKLKAEIKEVILNGDNDVSKLHENLSYDSISKLDYVTMCLKEGLRVDPPVPTSVYYKVKNEFVLPNGIKVHKDMKCTPHISILHHNPAIWKKPSEYIPERFDSESEYFLTPSGEKRHPMSFIPFIAGARNCIGQNFAMLEMKYIAVNLLSNFRLTQEKREVPLSFGIYVNTKLPMEITKLSSFDEE